MMNQDELLDLILRAYAINDDVQNHKQSTNLLIHEWILKKYNLDASDKKDWSTMCKIMFLIDSIKKLTSI